MDLPPPHDADATEPTQTDSPVASPNQPSDEVHDGGMLDIIDNPAYMHDSLIVTPRMTTGVANYKNMDLCEVMYENFVYTVTADSAPSRLFDFQVHVG